ISREASWTRRTSSSDRNAAGVRIMAGSPWRGGRALRWPPRVPDGGQALPLGQFAPTATGGVKCPEGKSDPDLGREEPRQAGGPRPTLHLLPTPMSSSQGDS